MTCVVQCITFDSSTARYMKATDLKVGDFVKGKYKYGCVCGVIESIAKNHVVIKKYQEWYSKYSETNSSLNLTISRIHEVGTLENGTLKAI